MVPLLWGPQVLFGGKTRSSAGEECSVCRDGVATEQGSVLKEPFSY